MTEQEVLAGLAPVFRTKLSDLNELCADAGFRVVPYCGFRSAAEQARLWMQSRSIAEVEERAAQLRGAGAPFVAHLLEGARPSGGPRVTNALPGQSWHQFGRAADCYIESPETSHALWRDNKVDGVEFGSAAQLYERFGRTAEAIGLTWGGRWALGDFGHVQLGRVRNPVAELGWAAVDAALVSEARKT